MSDGHKRPPDIRANVRRLIDGPSDIILCPTVCLTTARHNLMSDGHQISRRTKVILFPSSRAALFHFTAYLTTTLPPKAPTTHRPAPPDPLPVLPRARRRPPALPQTQTPARHAGALHDGARPPHPSRWCLPLSVPTTTPTVSAPPSPPRRRPTHVVRRLFK